ncbi:MAG: sigma-E processing peptidase SpoIIGA [Heliobacteriaceae bacterium]|nr:sigma-E processing peptidase SpoIIGA [Heliobacteriaceae bacterium]MDD4588071.1 sigma-E processing peptidase SpoIIGA [Heliobacteriaceae bacterium]
MGERLIIYWDILWLINFVMDYLLINLCGLVMHLALRPVRFLVAAAVGATLSIVTLWWPMGLVVTWGFQLGLSWLLLRIAFSRQPIWQRVQTWVVFYLGAWVTGGVLYALVPADATLGPWCFWLLCLLAGGIAGGSLLFWRQVRQQGGWLTELWVQLPAGAIAVPALVDSGNRLWDPVSGDPVIIVEFQCMAHLFPAGWWHDPATGGLAYQPRYIPYSALGKPDGLLLGIRPLQAGLRRQSRKVVCSQAVIGLTEQQLDPTGKYRALVPAIWEF